MSAQNWFKSKLGKQAKKITSKLERRETKNQLKKEEIVGNPKEENEDEESLELDMEYDYSFPDWEDGEITPNDEGWDAYNEGKKSIDNPYNEGSIEHEDWENGFYSAKQYYYGDNSDEEDDVENDDFYWRN